MTGLKDCIYCNGATDGGVWHEKCRTAHLGGLLASVQQAILKEGGGRSGSHKIKLPPELVQAILEEKLETPEALRRKQNAANRRACRANALRVSRIANKKPAKEQRSWRFDARNDWGAALKKGAKTASRWLGREKRLVWGEEAKRKIRRLLKREKHMIFRST